IHPQTQLSAAARRWGWGRGGAAAARRWGGVGHRRWSAAAPPFHVIHGNTNQPPCCSGDVEASANGGLDSPIAPPASTELSLLGAGFFLLRAAGENSFAESSFLFKVEPLPSSSAHVCDLLIDFSHLIARLHFD
ncbi:Os03g0581100, partial [Oryza sativa Japonica Group]